MIKDCADLVKLEVEDRTHSVRLEVEERTRLAKLKVNEIYSESCRYLAKGTPAALIAIPLVVIDMNLVRQGNYLAATAIGFSSIVAIGYSINCIVKASLGIRNMRCASSEFKSGLDKLVDEYKGDLNRTVKTHKDDLGKLVDSPYFPNATPH